ncbi:MFS transporter [Pedosphaera parvula]|uniref:Major facilitator superfamily MFS_1 n=1 Tax=Pedosphaera parvula (strain Ellin514) TaxID=320771 RepID=B9XCR0_PEDPL|nr:MFS transporter [Pedosphaera parvula]EEF62256.1 major facilitator superfamily MFS_1 [Pedosphaera parvula Ellin514]
MSSEPRPTFAKAMGLLRRGAFSRYMTGEAISMTGTWMQAMAQMWVMTSLTVKAVDLAKIQLASGIPMLLLTMVGGKFADRHNKRTILLITQVVQIILAVAVGFLVAKNQIQIWHILVVAVVLGISNSFEMPAASAMVPELVEKCDIATAVAIDRSVFHATRLIGPSAAGFLIGFWGTSSAFFVNAISFVALIIALLTIPRRAPHSEEEKEKRSGSMKAGFKHVRSDKPTWAMLLLGCIATFFVVPVMIVMMPLYARDILHVEARQLGILMSISSIGSLTGSITLLGVSRSGRRARLALAIIAVTIALMGMAWTHRVWIAAGCLILLSIGASTCIGLANIIVQERAPDHLRGRVSAVAGICLFGLFPIATLLVTSLADWIGMRTTIFATASIYAVGSIAVLAVIGHEFSTPLPETPNAETLQTQPESSPGS